MLGKLALGALFAAMAIQGHAAAAKAPPPDGTVVRGVDGGQAKVALMVGGARLPLADPEVAQAERGGGRVRTLSLPAYRALPDRIADGTFLAAPDSGTIWVVNGGRRALLPADQIPLRHVQVIPAGALERIPALGSGR